MKDLESEPSPDYIHQGNSPHWTNLSKDILWREGNRTQAVLASSIHIGMLHLEMLFLITLSKKEGNLFVQDVFGSVGSFILPYES
jgi:hypothetical protein